MHDQNEILLGSELKRRDPLVDAAMFGMAAKFEAIRPYANDAKRAFVLEEAYRADERWKPRAPCVALEAIQRLAQTWRPGVGNSK